MAREKESLSFWMVASSVLIISTVLAQDHALQFVHYQFSKADMRVDGMATIEAGRLKLTDNSEIATGHAFYKTPVDFKNTSFSFSTEFVCAIIPKDRGFGQGIAFLVSPTIDLRNGAPGSYLGIFNKTNDNRSDNHILAVELDSNENPEALDRNSNHVGININSRESVATADAGYYNATTGTNLTLVLGSAERIHTWIDYDGEQRLLNVTLAPFGIPKPSLPLLSISVDLSKIFKEKMYFGFSGSTSLILSQQYILGWSLSTGGKAKSLDIAKVLDLPPQLHPPSSPALTQVQVIIISVISAILLVMIPSGVLYLYFKKKYVEEFDPWEDEYSPQRFSFSALYRATRGFKEDRVLGSGGFGKVFRGDLPDGTQIAVKRISNSSRQGIQEYVSEVATLGRLAHRNILQLLGYCRIKGELLLVYEFMRNGSLSSYGDSLSWGQRVNIVKGVASGLHYLHEGWMRVVIHLDIKGSNILLDDDLNGKIGDFGLAKLCDRGTPLQHTRSAGTPGYVAPEVKELGETTTMSDVYSFGVFLLEVVCGRKPVERSRPSDEIDLVRWVANCSRRGCPPEEVIDTRLVGHFQDEEATRLLSIGLLCSQRNPEDRPSMGKILQYLEGTASAPEFSLELGNQVAPATTTEDEPTPPSSSIGSLGTVTAKDNGR